MTGAVASGSVDTVHSMYLRITIAMYCSFTPLCGSSSSFLSLIKGEFLFFIAQILVTRVHETRAKRNLSAS